MPDSVKRIDIKEFREFGFLQELNRQFLHPLGLALEVNVNEETGEETLGGVWDYRDDPEGLVYGGSDGYGLEPDKADRVEDHRIEMLTTRLGALGFGVQPIPDRVDPTRILDSPGPNRLDPPYIT